MVPLQEIENDYYRSLIHSLPFSMVVIDRNGTIIETNSNWDNFGEENGLDPRFFKNGINYLDACRDVEDDYATRACRGLKAVLDGRRRSFQLEYPCHSEDRKRWFLMQVFPVKESSNDYFIVTHLDITGRRLSEEKNKRLSAIVDKIPVCIVTLKQVHPEGFDDDESVFVVTNFNPCAETVTGMSHETVLGRPYDEVFDGLFEPDLPEKLADIARTNVNYEQHNVQSEAPEFEGRVWSLQAFNVTDEYLAIAFEDTTEEVENRERLEYLATYDELTGLPNRDHLLETFRTELERSGRYESPLSFLLMDLDHFKGINDTYGHVYGDEILEGVGGVLSDHTRTADTAGRYGGEEFGILLPETRENEACEFAERLRVDIEALEVTSEDGEVIPVTCSIGVSGRKSSDETLKDLLRRTDEALYEAKETGRNRVVCWSGGDGEDC